VAEDSIERRQSLLQYVRQVWLMPRPAQGVEECQASLDAAKSRLEEMQKWDVHRWQQERDAAHAQAIALAEQSAQANQPEREQLERNLALARRLHDQYSDDVHTEIRADFETLINWLTKLLESPEICVIVPSKKKPSLKNYRNDALSQVATDLHYREVTLKQVRAQWEAYLLGLSKISRIETALWMLPPA